MVPLDNLHIYNLLCLKLSLGYSSYQYIVSGVISCHCALFREHSEMHMQLTWSISERNSIWDCAYCKGLNRNAPCSLL